MAPGFELTGSSIVLDVNADVICTITNDDNGDAAQIPPPPTTTTTTTVAILPVTGSSSGSTVLIAGLGVLLGFAMTMLARRRRTACVITSSVPSSRFRGVRTTITKLITSAIKGLTR